jgi:hypothetical protein
MTARSSRGYRHASATSLLCRQNSNVTGKRSRLAWWSAAKAWSMYWGPRSLPAGTLRTTRTAKRYQRGWKSRRPHRVFPPIRACARWQFLVYCRDSPNAGVQQAPHFLLWLIASVVLCSQIGQTQAAESPSYILMGGISNPLGESVRTSKGFQLIEGDVPTFILHESGQSESPSSSNAGTATSAAHGNPLQTPPHVSGSHVMSTPSAAPSAPPVAGLGKVMRRKASSAASATPAKNDAVSRVPSKATVRQLRTRQGVTPTALQAPAAAEQLTPLSALLSVSSPPERTQAAMQLQASLLGKSARGTTGLDFMSLTIVMASFLAGLAFRPLVEGSLGRTMTLASVPFVSMFGSVAPRRGRRREATSGRRKITRQTR